MSTNPFRQIRFQQDAQNPSATGANQSAEPLTLPDGFGSRLGNGTGELSLDFKTIDPPFGRHVSFASPPVDSTFQAISYPSSPESARSPPNYFSRTGALATPDYRTAIQRDSFEDLKKDRQEDGTLQQAVSNAQSNISVSQPPGHHESHEESAVWDTLRRFDTAPPRSSPRDDPAQQSLQDGRKSLDVEAFKRLLLTGNTDAAGPQDQQNRRPAPPPPRNNAQNNPIAPAVPGTTPALPSLNTPDSREIDAKRALFIDSLVQSGQEMYVPDSTGKLPPPTPLPRRAKSIKSRGLSPVPVPAPALTPVSPAMEPISSNEDTTTIQVGPSKKPPAPPLARRQSQRIPSNKSDDSIDLPSPVTSPAEPARATNKLPPLTPTRKQPLDTSRRPSYELAPTIEEPETELVPTLGSRKSSMNRPTPVGSRNSSISMKRPMPGLMSPPPLPPPRKGRGSSRGSMDGRPSLTTIMGTGDGQENTFGSDQPKQATSKGPTASSADSILVELANLQKEVDAARRT